MNGPIKSVFEGAAVQDPNPLLLRRAPSKVRCRRCHANFPSLLLSLLFHFTCSQLVTQGLEKWQTTSMATPRRIPIGPDHTTIGPSLVFHIRLSILFWQLLSAFPHLLAAPSHLISLPTLFLGYNITSTTKYYYRECFP